MDDSDSFQKWLTRRQRGAFIDIASDGVPVCMGLTATARRRQSTGHGPESGKSQAAQNQTQSTAELSRTAPRADGETALFDQKRGCATQCDEVMGDTGLEPVTSSL